MADLVREGKVRYLGLFAPIPGTRRCERPDENLGALDVRLSPADLVEIERISPPEAIAGARYNERGMATVNR
jgi:aryl-alcohol dehydrogenase-like predicted oxidoreductase